MSAFDQLHPAIQHHVVNSFGWRSLRPLQDATIEPILAGHHILAMAPTAGGKTEAAILPVLSQILTEDRRGLSVLYVCPLRALLNNLHERLGHYASLVGRRVGLWHGDVTSTQRHQLLANPPDILLTTPESLEAMLVSTSVAHDEWFAGLRTVVIDEAHAFASDDRGWHLLAVLARLTRLAGSEIQRIALSATIGNPSEVLRWLTVGCSQPASVVNPPAPAASPPEITLDYVGSLDNAALVISRLHRGMKRLVFVDSRARAEKLAAALREHDVTTFVSHGSLGLDERRQAEQAFAEARNCVIVATSTLELGIDVGDLDHVLQIDAPSTVASLLQRLGRTGRRAGTSRNMTVLATDDESLLRASALLLRWSEGFVEPVLPPPLPTHLFGQQALAIALQEGQIGRHTWHPWFGNPFVLGEDVKASTEQVMTHLVEEDYLTDTGGGVLVIGQKAETDFGRRHFMELLAVFTAPPLFSVRHGRIEIGLVPDEVVFTRPPGSNKGPLVLLLAGKNWLITGIDWKRRVISVEPTDTRGAARWVGGGLHLGAAIARGVREVLCGVNPESVNISRRATDRLDGLRADHSWLRNDATAMVSESTGKVTWWTYAGGRANLWLASALSSLRNSVVATDGLSISLDHGTNVADLQRVLAATNWSSVDVASWVSQDAIDQLKFSDAIPRELALQEVVSRLRDDESRDAAVSERVISITMA